MATISTALAFQPDKSDPPVMWLPSTYPEIRPHDLELYRQELAGFVPPNAFDAHAHLYTVQGLNLDVGTRSEDAAARQGIRRYQRSVSSWMGEDCPKAGLYFAAPVSDRVDVAGENQFVEQEVAQNSGSRGLMLIRPRDDPHAAEAALRRKRFSGFKVYHVFARAADTYRASIGAFLPDWAWQLADQYGLVVTLHLVRRRALSDPENQRYICEHCSRYPNAKLILAHAARGFCARHTIDGINSLRGLDNVFFDTAAICESGALESVLRLFGPSRLMFGTDWPVCNARGRCVSVGDGFFWLHEHTADFQTAAFCNPTLIGIESLLALKQAAQTCRLSDSEVERVFCHTARDVLESSV